MVGVRHEHQFFLFTAAFSVANILLSQYTYYKSDIPCPLDDVHPRVPGHLREETFAYYKTEEKVVQQVSLLIMVNILM